MLSNPEILRYSRHLLLPQVGIEGNIYFIVSTNIFNKPGQIALKNAHILIIGAGGLGCSAILYLSAAGIGKLTIVDDDKISIENLHRQILYTQNDVGYFKSDFAKKMAISRNPQIYCQNLTERLTYENALNILNLNFNDNNLVSHTHLTSDFSLIIDATDNVETRYLINDLALFLNIPWIYGSAIGFEGHMSTFNYHSSDKDKSLCYKCLFPVPPPLFTISNCNEIGVFGALPGIIGMFQALEAQKILIPTLSPSYNGKLLIFDSLSNTGCFKEIQLRNKNHECSSCNQKMDKTRFIESGHMYNELIVKNCSIESNNSNKNHISVYDFVQFLRVHSNTCYSVIDVREKHELKICKLSNYNTNSILTLSNPLKVRNNDCINLCYDSNLNFS
ncbi:unnamed protein product, partial [Gordionus sp. m RMFG-2023]